MVLDPIPQPLPVHFYGSRPQPPTSRSGALLHSNHRALRNGAAHFLSFWTLQYGAPMHGAHWGSELSGSSLRTGGSGKIQNTRGTQETHTHGARRQTLFVGAVSLWRKARETRDAALFFGSSSLSPSPLIHGIRTISFQKIYARTWRAQGERRGLFLWVLFRS